MQNLTVDLSEALKITQKISILKQEIDKLKNSSFYNEFYHVPKIMNKQKKLDLLEAVLEKFPPSEITYKNKKDFEDFIQNHFKGKYNHDAGDVIEGKTKDALDEIYNKLKNAPESKKNYMPDLPYYSLPTAYATRPSPYGR